MSIIEYKITSISEYLEKITALRDNHEKLWFRGHERSNYTLMPAIYRAPYSWENETPLLHQFKARAIRFLNKTPIDDIEWLFIMQHHSTPTRLLDWSENALVALAFAVQYRKEDYDDDAVVWCLNPIKLNDNVKFPESLYEKIPNICTNETLQKMYENQRQIHPVAIVGPQNTEIIIAQRGVFTLFPNKESFTLESLENASDFLIKIIIDKEYIENIKKDLYYIGITESSLFPELDSISKELKRSCEGGI